MSGSCHSDDDLPPTVAEPSGMYDFIQPDTVPVVMVNMPTGVSSGACISDWVGALDHPVGKPLLDGILMAHPTDIFVPMNESDTVLDTDYPIIPHNRIRKIWRLSVFESDSPDFLYTGNPDICFGMLRSRDGVGNVESDCDTALLARGCFPGL